VSKNQKGEPLIEIVCVGCGRAQHLRKKRLCRATVTPVASAAIVLRTPSFIFPLYRRVVCVTLFQTQRVHSADPTHVLQPPKNKHRLPEHGIFSKEEKPNFHANREGIHG
jgi:hypothetical protein